MTTAPAGMGYRKNEVEIKMSQLACFPACRVQLKAYFTLLYHQKILPVKPVLLFSLFTLLVASVKAQNVTSLPAGKYETKMKTNQNKWEKGDLIIIDDSHYKLSSSNETGDYRFSV